MKILFVSLFIVCIDQISKLYVKGISIPFLNIDLPGMSYGKRMPVIGDVFNITFVENPGIAFGIDFGADYKMLLSLVTLAAALGLTYYLYLIRKKSFLMKFSMSMIVGGAFGNLIDRMFYGVIFDYAPLMYGKVVDFFDINLLSFYLFNRTFGSYIFNIADVAVTAGVILLLFAYNRQNAAEEEEILIDNYIAENKES